MTKPDLPQFHLTLKALPRHRDEDGDRLLQSILKSLLRVYGSRCTRVEWPPHAVWGAPNPDFDLPDEREAPTE